MLPSMREIMEAILGLLGGQWSRMAGVPRTLTREQPFWSMSTNLQEKSGIMAKSPM